MKEKEKKRREKKEKKKKNFGTIIFIFDLRKKKLDVFNDSL